MARLPKIVKAIRAESNTQWLTKLSQKTWVNKTSLWKLKTQKKCKYKKNTLDVLYQFFELDRDAFYQDNMKKRYPPTFSVIGNILREKRIAMWLSVAEVAKHTKWDKRQVFRIEAWDSLPAFNSWYMTQLMELYEFDEEEKGKIMWGIAILKDLIKINNKYEEKDLIEKPKEKWHWKKTVTRI